MISTITLKESDHVVEMRRYDRGRSMVGNAKLYGYELSCKKCDWTRRVNEQKRWATLAARDHLRAYPKSKET